MSSGAEQLLKSTTLLIKGLEDVTRKSVAKSTGAMLKANKDQLDQGSLNTDSPITPTYSPSYAKFKGFTIPDLQLTGDWVDSKFIDVLPDELRWGATDWKNPLLIGKYGVDIHGNTETDANKIFNDRIYPPINKFIDKSVERYV